jgi:hypothetical protein
MKTLVLFVALLATAPVGQAALASAPMVTATETLAHGGGCRKRSPPGQCCHMDNRTGKVHCH